MAINVGHIDRSGDDTLTRWIYLATEPEGDSQAVLELFHNNSQGANHLDRHLGKLMMTSANLRNREFGMKFSTYGQHCKAKRAMPTGRASVAMAAMRFRLARHRGHVLKHVHLTNVQLQGDRNRRCTLFRGTRKGCHGEP